MPNSLEKKHNHNLIITKKVSQALAMYAVLTSNKGFATNQP